MSLLSASGLLICPTCGAPLAMADTSASCPAGHSYDIARQGYLNLLGRPQPGNADTVAMIDARGRVLASVYADVVALVAEAVAATRAAVIVDAGAGTGQYLAASLDRLPGAVGIATDVSVAAARRAAGAHPRLAAIVADTWRGLPLRAGAAQTVCCVFAPRNPSEFSRILAPGGQVVIVTPEPGHLATLRATYGLLDLDPDKEERLERSMADRFALVTARRFTRQVEADAEQVCDIITMGPNAFHGAPNAGPSLIEIDLACRTYVRLDQGDDGDDDLPHREDRQHRG